jgi:iron complex transport system substrate-binding protein
MISQNSAPGLEQRPGWSGMRALRERRVCIFTTEQSDALVRAGPRLAQAARLMAECIAAKGAPDHR